MDKQIQFEIFKPEYLIGTVDTDGLVHQGICCYSAGYAPMCFQYPLLLTWFNFNLSMDK